MKILHKISKLKQDWNTSSPIWRLNRLLKVGKFGGYLVGIRFLGDCKIVWYSGKTGFVISIYYILAIYTLIHYAMENRIVDGLPCWSMSGLYLSSMVAYANALTKRHRIYKIGHFGQTYLYNEEFDEICSKSVNKTVKRFMIIMGIILASVILGSINPVYIWYRDGIFYSLAGVRFPFVEQNSNLNIMLNIILQLLLGYNAINGLTLLQTYQGTLMNAIELSADISIKEMINLSDYLEGGNADDAVIKKHITKIFRQIQRIDGYIKNASDCHYWYFFLSSPFITYSIGLSIYAQYIMGFPPGYGIALMSYVQMAVLYYIGQVVVDRNNRIRYSLYSDLKWYLLPPKYQRDVCFMMKRMQNGATLTIGPFQTLNFETLRILTQRIQSFIMFLLNFH
uniref:Odorant receptor n=1 Tax=Mayetiola destructor TaxID=39758 RepID=A0A1D8GZG2_MAYDE|nr:odorant receptor 112 [Mayetiola destructor]